MATKAEKIVELAGIIDKKAERVKKLKVECGQQATKICVLELRITELEGKIQSAKDIVSSQSFWCELADQECVGLKSIVHLVEQALKGGE